MLATESSDPAGEQHPASSQVRATVSITRLINRCLQMQLLSTRNQTRYLHISLLLSVAALLFKPANKDIFSAAQISCTAVMVLLYAARTFLQWRDVSAHGNVLKTLGWDGWDVAEDPQCPQTAERLRVALEAASKAMERKRWWDLRLVRATKLFAFLSFGFYVAGTIARVSARLSQAA